ncbi:MAG: hypothetical protein JSV03_15840 [Planctomycetota bacterium]|nr:MAG: hypothetical protein JSV03_15840 [Planctomycetota bacterium]
MATYPNQTWPSDATIEALDGTTDTQTGLPYVAKGTGPTSVPSYEIQYNRHQHRRNQILAGWRQGMVVDEGSLKIGVYPIKYTQAGARKNYTGTTGVSVPDNSSKVVYLDSSSTLQVADAWPGDITTFLPLASIETSNGQMTITDLRVYTTFHVPSLEASGVKDRRIVTAHRASVGNSESDTEIFEFDPPEDLTLDEVQVYCTAAAATAGVDVKEAGVSVLSSSATPSAGAVVKPTISDSSISASNNVTVHVTTDGTGSITDLTVTLIFKAVVAA